MGNMNKLKDAPDHVKNLRVTYDMSKDERETLGKMVEVAKEKTKACPNWFYKVRGPPWDLKEIAVRKRKQSPPNPNEN